MFSQFLAIFFMYCACYGYSFTNTRQVKISMALNELKPSGSVESLIAIFSDAAVKKKVPIAQLKQAFVDIESVLTSKPVQKITKLSISGRWELVVSTLFSSGYLPVYEECDFFEYSLTSAFGPIYLGKVSGGSKILTEKHPYQIELTPISYQIGPLSVKLDSSRKRVYTFLYADNELAIAKSSSGGYSLLKKVSKSRFL